MSPLLFYDWPTTLKTLAASLTMLLTIYLQALNASYRKAWLVSWKIHAAMIPYENMDLVDRRITFSLQEQAAIGPRPWWNPYRSIQFPSRGDWVIHGLKSFIYQSWGPTPSPCFALNVRKDSLMAKCGKKCPPQGATSKIRVVEFSRHRSLASCEADSALQAEIIRSVRSNLLGGDQRLLPTWKNNMCGG